MLAVQIGQTLVKTDVTRVLGDGLLPGIDGQETNHKYCDWKNNTLQQRLWSSKISTDVANLRQHINARHCMLMVECVRAPNS